MENISYVHSKKLGCNFLASVFCMKKVLPGWFTLEMNEAHTALWGGGGNQVPYSSKYIIIIKKWTVYEFCIKLQNLPFKAPC